MGRRIGIEVKPSPQPLITICNALSVLPEETIMIGDSELDVQCGKNANTKTCAAAWGYRSKNILEKENPDYIVEKFYEVLFLI